MNREELIINDGATKPCIESNFKDSYLLAEFPLNVLGNHLSLLQFDIHFNEMAVKVCRTTGSLLFCILSSCVVREIALLSQSTMKYFQSVFLFETEDEYVETG